MANLDIKKISIESKGFSQQIGRYKYTFSQVLAEAESYEFVNNHKSTILSIDDDLTRIRRNLIDHSYY